jgi:hypothetical protein
VLTPTAERLRIATTPGEQSRVAFFWFYVSIVLVFVVVAIAKAGYGVHPLTVLSVMAYIYAGAFAATFVHWQGYRRADTKMRHEDFRARFGPPGREGKSEEGPGGEPNA